MSKILNYSGHILIIFSFFFLAPAVVAFIYHESALIFIVTFFLTLLAGFICRKLVFFFENEKSYTDLSLLDGILLSTWSFVFLSVIGCIPYLTVFTGTIGRRVLDSFFECVAGFTTSGLTVFSSVELIPHSILFWRAETQWLGGIGIVIVFLFILAHISKKRGSIHDEAIVLKTQSFGDEILETRKDVTVKGVILIYCAYTAIGILFLLLFGMPLFESITTTFTALSGGGFFVNDLFNPTPPQLTIISLLMIASIISFVAHHQLFKGRFKEFFSNIELKFFVVTMFIVFLISFFLVRNLKLAWFMPLSAYTETGFQIVNPNTLPTLMIFMMMIVMIIGGSAGSTAGGIKISRAILALKSIPLQVKRLMHPKSAIIPMKINKHAVNDEDILSAHIFIWAYLLLIVIGVGILMLIGYGWLDSSFQVVSAIGTCGLQTITVLGTMPALGKWVLILLMLFGRLEIFPLLIIFRRFVRKGRY